MIQAVNPGLRVWLSTLNGPNIVGLAKVVPGNDLCKVDLVTVADESIPSCGIQMGIRVVNPLIRMKLGNVNFRRS